VRGLGNSSAGRRTGLKIILANAARKDGVGWDGMGFVGLGVVGERWARENTYQY
jgi:hypothetical protein